jgi:hypothetical protein
MAFHRNCFSSKWDFIEMAFHQSAFHQNGFSSKWLFIEMAFNQNGFSSKWLFIEVAFHQTYILVAHSSNGKMRECEQKAKKCV